MGEAEIIHHKQQLIIRSVFFFYGNAASEELSREVTADIQQHWNEANGTVNINRNLYQVHFHITGHHAPVLTPEDVFENTHPQYNYFRIENFAHTEVSFVDGIGSNTGYFLLQNLLNNSTTAAHEYGHTLGLVHPDDLDIRGHGVPGIMYPRGTMTDAAYQYNPLAISGDNTNGGTMNPHTRKVLQKDIDDLRLHRLRFDRNGFAIVGEFTSIWHEAHEAYVPPEEFT